MSLWKEKKILLTGCREREELLIECNDSSECVRLARARACTRTNVCIRLSMSAVCFLTMCPLTNAWSFTSAFSALSALLPFKCKTIKISYPLLRFNTNQKNPKPKGKNNSLGIRISFQVSVLPSHHRFWLWKFSLFIFSERDHPQHYALLNLHANLVQALVGWRILWEIVAQFVVQRHKSSTKKFRDPSHLYWGHLIFEQ